MTPSRPTASMHRRRPAWPGCPLRIAGSMIGTATRCRSSSNFEGLSPDRLPRQRHRPRVTAVRVSRPRHRVRLRRPMPPHHLRMRHRPRRPRRTLRLRMRRLRTRRLRPPRPSLRPDLNLSPRAGILIKHRAGTRINLRPIRRRSASLRAGTPKPHLRRRPQRRLSRRPQRPKPRVGTPPGHPRPRRPSKP